MPNSKLKVFRPEAKCVGSGEVDDTIQFWRVSITAVYLGYRQYVEDEVHEDYCAAKGIQVVRRVPSGGCGFSSEVVASLFSGWIYTSWTL